MRAHRHQLERRIHLYSTYYIYCVQPPMHNTTVHPTSQQTENPPTRKHHPPTQPVRQLRCPLTLRMVVCCSRTTFLRNKRNGHQIKVCVCWRTRIRECTLFSVYHHPPNVGELVCCCCCCFVVFGVRMRIRCGAHDVKWWMVHCGEIATLQTSRAMCDVRRACECVCNNVHCARSRSLHGYMFTFSF